MKRETKLALRSVAKVSGETSKWFAVGSLIMYSVGVVCCLILDRGERKEVNNKKK